MVNAIGHDASPITKFWWHGVDIMVNAASALLVAGIVGAFWFLKKEFELWYEEKKRANEEARAIAKQLFGLKHQMVEVERASDAKSLVHEVEALFLLHFELLHPAGVRFFEKWFSTKRIYQALRSEPIVRTVWYEFLSDIAGVKPTPVYRSFPFMPQMRRKSPPLSASK